MHDCIIALLLKNIQIIMGIRNSYVYLLQSTTHNALNVCTLYNLHCTMF